MSIPNLPAFYDMPYINKDGKLTAQAQLHNDNTFQTMNQAIGTINTNISNNGIVVTPKTTAEIAAITVAAGTVGLWFNTNLNKLQFKTSAGTVETITST